MGITTANHADTQQVRTTAFTFIPPARAVEAAMGLIRAIVPMLDMKLVMIVQATQNTIETKSPLEFIPIRSEELQLMLPADSPLIPDFEKNGADMKKLDDTPVIIHQQNSFFQTLELSVFSDNGISPRILCEISDTLALINMVENHKGFAFIPRSISGSSSNVRCFSLENRVEFFIVMAYHKDTLLSDPMKALIKLILESYDPMSNRSSSLNGL